MEQTKYLKKSIDDFGKEYVKQLIIELTNADKKATGNLVRSINYKLIEATNEFLIQVIAADYLKYVDEGRAPGKMPPVDKIIAWAKVRNIQPKPPKYKTIDQVGWAIAKGIQKNGIKPTNVIDKSVSKLLQNKRAIDPIAKAYGNDWVEMINKLFSDITSTYGQTIPGQSSGLR